MPDTYEHVAGFVSNLTAKLADVDTDLPIYEQHLAMLATRLAGGKYTYLLITDNTNTEYVRLQEQGGRLFLLRGQETTKPATFPVGSCVKWELTPAAVRDIVCQMPCCP